MATRKTKRVRFKDSCLREWFDLFNSRYFGNKLKVRYIRFGYLPKGALGNTHRITYRVLSGPRDRELPVHWSITICPTQAHSRRLACLTLLHEMVHLEQENMYSCNINGHRFNRRMKELANAGAFNGLW